MLSKKIAWIIETENRDGYKTGCFETKSEAIYRLNEMILNPFYNCGLQTITRTNDMVKFSDDSIFKIVKLSNVLTVK